MALPKEDIKRPRTAAELESIIRAWEEHHGVDSKYSHNVCPKCDQSEFRPDDPRDGVVQTIQCAVCGTWLPLCCMCDNLSLPDKDVCEKCNNEIVAEQRADARIILNPFEQDRYCD